MIHSVTAYSLDASATLHEQHPPSMCGFPHNNGICHFSIQIFLLFFQKNCKYIEQYMLYFPSSNQLHIHKTLPLIPCQVCGVFDCANPGTVAQVCPSVENTECVYYFLHNTVKTFPSISYSCMSLLFLREQFLPKYSIFTSQIYLQLFRSPWKLIYGFTNVSRLLHESS